MRENSEMDLIERLKSSHSMLGDPLHREAWEKIESLLAEIKSLRRSLNFWAHLAMCMDDNHEPE